MTATRTNAEHSHHDNGGATCNWKILLIRPPLRGVLQRLAKLVFRKQQGMLNESNWNHLVARRY